MKLSSRYALIRHYKFAIRPAIVFFSAFRTLNAYFLDLNKVFSNAIDLENTFPGRIASVSWRISAYRDDIFIITV